MKLERLTNPIDKPYYSDMEERLLDIENILGDDYDLDRLRELAQADREGRCVVLPYKPPKVGDVVYEPVYGHGVVRNTITFSDGLTFEARGKGGNIQFCISDIGKSVFLDPAEAKKVFNARKGGVNDGKTEQ